jgi:hypothetical protein
MYYHVDRLVYTVCRPDDPVMSVTLNGFLAHHMTVPGSCFLARQSDLSDSSLSARQIIEMIPCRTVILVR